MRIGVWRGAWRLASVAFAATLLVAGCGLLEESPPVATPTPATSNVVVDPGFETSDPPAWRWPNDPAPFEATTVIARSGQRSAALTPPNGTVAQTLNISEVPEFLSGYYRVDEWPDGAAAYLQFTVRAASDGPEPVRALWFVLAGAAAEAEVPPPDARYVFLSRDPPVVGEWTYFAYPIREAFIARTLAVPSGFSSLDITLEVRTVGGEQRDPVTAYYDDLYAGPQAGNPNRPRETRD